MVAQSVEIIIKRDEGRGTVGYEETSMLLSPGSPARCCIVLVCSSQMTPGGKEVLNELPVEIKGGYALTSAFFLLF